MKIILKNQLMLEYARISISKLVSFYVQRYFKLLALAIELLQYTLE